ncbi:hypothetical protein COV49_03665 [Candidatus Falkowbacteria bacterium CG11_big_fil_rev_8_21_14_0_20_39_10]|uniref:N-acetyltransferase domain-containing protein n=1 Tax=Candidatus Falkowbacteria bacterium CG11_big_fil_rev_8_21_14_0_20_39_10 TaxID=1974570 RepID=A0A2M6K8G4_9BACT|nr:MAG: hypothetical protein COV49_03665 [Candidatus Falkowbacteria bacterium CG11_big_fil_rev_8_21_14_0_20_39_10]
MLDKKNNLVRKAKPEDSKRIWEIRNHPEIRKLSNNPREFSFAEHDPRFEKKYFSNQKHYCFILENEDARVVGYCRIDFDSDNDNYIISIALDPEHHGKGLGTKLLSAAVEMFPAEKEILAEIHKENIISVKLFKKVGFVYFNEDEKNYYYKLKK